MTAKKALSHPQPIRSEERICFGIRWFESEAEALQFDEIVRAKGTTYNGGYMHGMPCGRDTSYDVKDETGKTIEFAVTN